MNSVKIDDGMLVDNFKRILREEYPNDLQNLENLLDEFTKASNFDEKIDKTKEIYNKLLPIVGKPLKELDSLSTRIYQSDKVLETLKKDQKLEFKFKKYKRDNFVHQLRVFLFGCWIMYQNKEHWLNHINTSLILFGLKRFLEDKVKVDFKLLLSLWGISALFHDCGRIYEYLGELVGYCKDLYSGIANIHNHGLYGDNFNVINLLESIDDLKKRKDIFFLFAKMLSGNIGAVEIYNKLNDSYNKMKHGVFGAILITPLEHRNFLEGWMKLISSGKKIGQILSNRDFVKNSVNMSKEVRKALLVSYSSISVAVHDSPELYFITPLSQLLYFVDNTQEWDRITKIGDLETPIFPCKEVKISVGHEEVIGYTRLHIKTEITYDYGSSHSEGELAKLIFERWDPEKRFQELDRLDENEDLFKLTMEKVVEKTKKYITWEFHVKWVKKELDKGKRELGWFIIDKEVFGGGKRVHKW